MYKTNGWDRSAVVTHHPQSNCQMRKRQSLLFTNENMKMASKSNKNMLRQSLLLLIFHLQSILASLNLMTLSLQAVPENGIFYKLNKCSAIPCEKFSYFFYLSAWSEPTNRDCFLLLHCCQLNMFLRDSAPSNLLFTFRTIANFPPGGGGARGGGIEG